VSGRPKSLDVGVLDCTRLDGQLLGELEKGGGRLVETGGPPVLGESICYFVFDLITEVVQVCRYSVVALVDRRSHHRQHLALRTAEW
jgi:hypothetical protein